MHASAPTSVPCGQPSDSTVSGAKRMDCIVPRLGAFGSDSTLAPRRAVHLDLAQTGDDKLDVSGGLHTSSRSNSPGDLTMQTGAMLSGDQP